MKYFGPHLNTYPSVRLVASFWCRDILLVDYEPSCDVASSMFHRCNFPHTSSFNYIHAIFDITRHCGDYVERLLVGSCKVISFQHMLTKSTFASMTLCHNVSLVGLSNLALIKMCCRFHAAVCILIKVSAFARIPLYHFFLRCVNSA